MTASPPPAQRFSPHTSGLSTLITPSSTPSYTFHWICPLPSCHTCPTRSRPATLAPEGQFDNYDDMQQLEHEYEHEEMGNFTTLPPMLIFGLMRFYRFRDVGVPHGVSGAADVC